MRHLLALLACTSPTAPTSSRYGFDEVPQRCVFALQAPEALSGSDPTYYVEGTDCVPPEGGDAFTVGFGWPGGVLHLEAPRPVAGVVQLRELGLYMRVDGQGWCVDWDGQAVIADLPAWSVAIDGTCVDEELRVVGRIGAQ
jgi:hypothetical protein